MLERIEIKKLVKQAVSRDPPLNWYLYHMYILLTFKTLSKWKKKTSFRRSKKVEQ
nr:MAG TPA: hypothetical protein [Caudoviricetes sp.]